MGPELDLRPQLERLARLICWSEGIDEGALSFAFRPLWQLDEPAKAALALSRAQATQVYAGLKLWPDAVVARLAEAQLVADGTYPNAAAVFAEIGATADAGKAQTALDFSPMQPRDLGGRWTCGAGGLSTETAPSETALTTDGPGLKSPDGTAVNFSPVSFSEPAANPHAPDGTLITLVGERGGGGHGSKKKKKHGGDGSGSLFGRFGKFVRGLLPEEPDDPEPVTPDRPPPSQKQDEPETQQPTTHPAQTEKNRLAQKQDARIRSDLADKWIQDDGHLNWPEENNGADGPEVPLTLQPGQIVDRYGEATGAYLSPQGTPFPARSLPYDVDRTPLRTYRVAKPFVVDSGRAAPWFDQPGGGMQYHTRVRVQRLISDGYLKEN